MACNYSCDDQTRIHESKEGIPFIVLRITLSFLHWIRKSYEWLLKTCAHHLRKKNAYISNHHTNWKHSNNLKEKIRKDIWLFHSLAYEHLVSRRKEFPWVFSFRMPRPVSSHHQVAITENWLSGSININWSIREGFMKKIICSFGFCPNEGEERPCPKFLSPFHKCIQCMSLKGVYFLQNDNNLNFKLFFYAKNVNLSDIQNDLLSKILLK